MIDTDMGDLLASIRDALTLPAATTDTGRADRDALERTRADAVRQAVDYVAGTGDLTGAVDLLDNAIAASPITYQAGHERVPRQGVVAR
ncbi:hypothetical protein [Nocardiopsis lucentensis]|uniref:hypothetical protein n=1 Tax=Nocardiopsis lucentensis TaxID=53441 RepID=UPI0003448EB2|nr:hypothetical protein [Nocardiopsis lucentensis]